MAALALLDQPPNGDPVSTRLVDRLRGLNEEPASPTGPEPHSAEYDRVKRELHASLISSLDLQRVRTRPRAELEPQLRTALGDMVRARALPLNRDEQVRVIEDVLDEVLGLGPIERLLKDPTITDILINGPDTVYVERRGKLERAEAHFLDNTHLLHIIERIVSAVGRRIDESSPMVDARLADGSRFNAIIPPLALDGPIVSIRRFGADPIKADDLVRLGSVPGPIMRFLDAAVHAKLNILVSGGTGTGKTTLLNVLSAYIPPAERVITIEDAAELRLQQPHVVRLETRPPNIEGSGEVTTRDLVRNALRMRPDRIIVGEVRGAEVIDMLQAMNTGHEGSLCTVHANSPRHALRRLETMVGLGLGNIPGPAIREMISDALDLVVHVSRLQDGTRRVTSVSEITGIEQGVIAMQEIFRFHQRTVEAAGKVRGEFEATGVRPNCAAKIDAYGLSLPPETYRFRFEV